MTRLGGGGLGGGRLGAGGEVKGHLGVLVRVLCMAQQQRSAGHLDVGSQLTLLRIDKFSWSIQCIS